jgi:8-oxo-dGTP diphosphatase
VKHPRHIVCVCGGFRDADGRILLVRTPRRGWELPGGQVELGEDLVAALEREVREESGCNVSVDQLVSVCTNRSPPEMVIFTFTGRHLAGLPRADNETTDAAWFTPEEAVAVVTHPASAARLRDAVQDTARPLYRAYRHQPAFAVDIERSL